MSEAARQLTPNAAEMQPSAVGPIRVKWEKDIYRNEGGNMYTVALYHKLDEEGHHISAVMCVGTALPKSPKVIYMFDGSWVINHKYGKQFQVTGYVEDEITGKDQILDYLTSGMLKGVGKVLAKRIYDAFGDQTLAVLDQTPEKLKKIKGVTDKKYKAMMESYGSHRGVTNIYKLLRPYGLTTTGATKIFQKFGAEAMNIIEKRPYALCSVKDVGFPIADRYALKQGMAPTCYERFCACAKLVLIQHELEDGSLGMDPVEFARGVRAMMNVNISDELYWNHIRKMRDDKRLAFVKTEDGHHLVYRRATYDAEVDIASNIARLCKRDKTKQDNLDKLITKYEKKYNLKLDPIQADAVHMAITQPFSLIIGGPGTGKTTIIRIIADIFEEISASRDSMIFMAPTGRAARKIHEATGRPASTIHSRLRLADVDNGTGEVFSEDKDSYIDEGLIVCDESSMIDVWVANKLLSSIGGTSKVILLGDANQLQSVGAGAFLRDIIASGVVPYMKLQTVFRQGKTSCIYRNAELIEKGNAALEEGDDFEIHDGLKDVALEDAMVEAFQKDVETYGIDNVACLCAVKDRAAGVISMNKRLQEALNPEDASKDEIKYGDVWYRVGDRVMELKNGDVVVNGDIGVIVSVKTGKTKEIKVRYFDTDDVVYKSDDFSHLALAYAMTVHKAQGSEYASVITCLQDANRHMLKRNIPYTAFTRGRQIVRFFGSRNALSKAIANDDTEHRKTCLSYYLKLLAKKNGGTF